jgi:hypothetical protein
VKYHPDEKVGHPTFSIAHQASESKQKFIKKVGCHYYGAYY